MWACCTDTSSDDDEHNTDNDALLLFGHAVVAPHLLSHLSALDVLALALEARLPSTSPLTITHCSTSGPETCNHSPPLVRWLTNRCSVPRRCDHREGARGLIRFSPNTRCILSLCPWAEAFMPQPAARVDAHAPEPRSLARLS